MPRLEGKVAVVTGAASGIGLGIARLFAAEGAKVVATDVSVEALNREVETVRSAGGIIFGAEQDVADASSWSRVVEEAIATYGKMDILVNNAAIQINKGVLQADLDDWNKVMSVNLTSVWLGAKAVIPHLQENGGGSIINVSSIAAMISGLADGGGAAYSASKGGVRSLTKHIAYQFAKDNIRVNSIHPGSIYSGMHKAYGLSKEESQKHFGHLIPLPPHIGEPEDIAYGAVYLASDESKHVTGTEAVIDGGWTTH